MKIETNSFQKLREEGLYLNATNRKNIVVLLNCAIMTGNDGIYSVDSINENIAKKTMQDADIIISAIGHESTADIMSTLLGITIPNNRIDFKMMEGEIAIIFQLNKRLLENKILSRQEIESIGYTWKLVKKYYRNPFI